MAKSPGDAVLSEPVSNQKDFLRYADQCDQLADDGDVAHRRDALTLMSDAWRQLAAGGQRFAEPIRDVDKFRCEPVDSMGARLRRASWRSSRIH